MFQRLRVPALVLATAATISGSASADVINVHTSGGNISSPAPGQWYDAVVVPGPGKFVYGTIQANGQGVYGVAMILVDGQVLASETLNGGNVHVRPANDPLQVVYDAQAAGGAVIVQYTPPEAIAFKGKLVVKMRINNGSAIPTTFGAEVQTGDYPQ